jgi:hypothetical protein
MKLVLPRYQNQKRTWQKRKLQTNFLHEHKMQKFSIKYLKTKSNNTLKTIIPGHQWLTSIILATQGAEIRRITV